MGQGPISRGHRWRVREVRMDDEIYVHRQCLVCRRDLVRPPDVGVWKAVHVGGLRFDFLDEETTRRWLTEECPGEMLPSEANSQRMLRPLAPIGR
jgi:hypothetical protein